MTVVETNKIGSLQGCTDFKQREEAHDDEDITAKSIATAFQFGVALGFAKKYDEMDKVIEEVKKAITPERKTGKWIHGREIAREMIGDCITAIFYEGWKCSECECVVEEEREPLWNYCPNCGAKMRGEL